MGILNWFLSTLTNTPTQGGGITWLVVFNGESNSGGRASNASPTAGELAARASVQILNNTTLAFEDLDIGTNNRIGHAQLTDNSEHGLELSLANAVEAGRFAASRVFLVKTGQGGSTVADWADESSYSTTMQSRFAAVLSLLQARGLHPVPVVMISLGINNAIAGTPAATFKAGLIAHIARIRATLGPTTIVALTKFVSPPLSAGDQVYNTVFDEIAASDSYTFAVDTSGTTAVDVHHWDYSGLKIIGERVWDAFFGVAQAGTPTISIDTEGLVTISGGASVRYTTDGSTPTSSSSLYTVPLSVAPATTVKAIAQAPKTKNSAIATATYAGVTVQDVVWESVSGATQSGATLSSSSSGTGGQASLHIDATKAFTVEWDQTTALGQNGVVVFLHTSALPYYGWDSGINDGYVAGLHSYGSTMYRTIAQGGISVGSISYPSKFRLTKFGNDLLHQYSIDGGTTWNTLYTGTGFLTDKTTLYLRALFAIAGAKSVTVRAAGTPA